MRIDHPHDAEAVLQVATTIGGIAAERGTPETMWVRASFTEDQNDARDALLGVAAMLPTGKIGPVPQISRTTGHDADDRNDSAANEVGRWIDHGDLLDPETNPRRPATRTPPGSSPNPTAPSPAPTTTESTPRSSPTVVASPHPATPRPGHTSSPPPATWQATTP